MSLSRDELENKFKKNLLNMIKRLQTHINDAVECNIIGGMQIQIIQGVMPAVNKALEDKSGKEFLEGFIRSSRDKNESEEEYKQRKYPKYWGILKQLPTPQEYIEDKKREKVEPLNKDVENFFIHNLHILFPTISPFKDLIQTIYTAKMPDGSSFLSIMEKRYLGTICRSFAIISIKYINLIRDPKIIAGKLVTNEGKILYNQGGNPFCSDISVKECMKAFDISIDDMLS